MRLEEIILKHLQELPGPEKAEVLNFIEYLQAKTEKKVNILLDTNVLVYHVAGNSAAT